MTLQAMQLDDLTWNEMVEAIRGRIAANSDGEWTMHGPLDPGVTLLELFAYLFEQRVYWLDQVPEPLVRAMLSLLDDAPLTTTCSKTLLEFRSLDNGIPQMVPAGSVFHPRDQLLPLPLTTLESVSVLPFNNRGQKQSRIDLIVNNRNHGPDLRAGRLVPLMPADGRAAEFQIMLWLDRPLAPDEFNGHFTLFFDLDTASSILPEWAALPHNIQWFNRITPLGYPRRILDPDNLIIGSCHLPLAHIGTTGLDADSDKLPSSDPEFWMNDFISKGWSYNHLQAKPPAELKWQYSTGPGARKAFNDTQLVDATGGLRRSGLVRVQIPADWQPVAAPAGGAVGYAIWISCDNCNFSAPPRLYRLLPNAVVAQQLESIHPEWAGIAPQVSDWLRLPGQQLRLPVDKPEPLEDSVHLDFREGDGQWYAWRPTDHFYHHGPEDRVFVVDRPRKRLLFGNGFTGRIPVLDIGNEPYARLCYLAGGGIQGNFGELVWTSKATDLQPINPVPGVGGAEAETLVEAKARMAVNLTQRERAVTAEDFERLAESTPGIAIARAHAAVGYHPGFACHPVPGAITLFLVPQVPRETALFETGEVVKAPKPDPGALAEVNQRIDTRRLVTSEVYVCPAQYRMVRLKVELRGVFVHQESLLSEISLALTQYLDPLIGGDSGLGWPFGGPLRPSSLIKEIQKHVDTGIIVQRVAINLDASNVFEDCADVLIGKHELIYLQDVSFKVDRTPTTQGGLR